MYFAVASSSSLKLLGWLIGLALSGEFECQISSIVLICVNMCSFSSVPIDKEAHLGIGG